MKSDQGFYCCSLLAPNFWHYLHLCYALEEVVRVEGEGGNGDGGGEKGGHGCEETDEGDGGERSGDVKVGKEARADDRKV